MDSIDIISQSLHWVRPWWLLALIPLMILLWRSIRLRGSRGQWDQLVDEHLREYVLEPQHTKSSVWPLIVLALGWLLCVLVLSGPVWEKRPAPAFRSLQAQVIALDLSRSMDADDLKPSRLARAKHKVADILGNSEGMQTGLVVFSEVAYVVSPLTDDVTTLQAFLPSLETDVVPVQGSQLASAIEKSVELLERSAVQNGNILVITDAMADKASQKEASLAAENGFRVSILAAATSAGRPIVLGNGSFLKDPAGQIVIARLDAAGLRQVAESGDGQFVELASDDSDITALAAQLGVQSGGKSEQVDRNISQWIERAPLLLLLVLPFAALCFRRGVFE